MLRTVRALYRQIRVTGHIKHSIRIYTASHFPSPRPSFFLEILHQTLLTRPFLAHGGIVKLVDFLLIRKHRVDPLHTAFARPCHWLPGCGEDHVISRDPQSLHVPSIGAFDRWPDSIEETLFIFYFIQGSSSKAGFKRAWPSTMAERTSGWLLMISSIAVGCIFLPSMSTITSSARPRYIQSPGLVG